MASGKAHERATEALALPAGVAAALLAGPGAGVAAALGCLSGRYISPDLDMEQITLSERRMLQQSMLLGVIWYVLWAPYALLVSHREPLSHWPLLGTAGRVAYLAGWVWLAAAVAGWEIPWTAVWGSAPLRWWAAGLAASDAAHWIMDNSPLFRRRRRDWKEKLLRALIRRLL